VEEFWAAVMPEFCAVPPPSVGGLVVASGASVKPIWERVSHQARAESCSS
jgi:hypothetical protein